MIIYVEDNINNQRLMCRMLTKWGLDALCYDTAEAGYDAAIQEKPDLIFVDVHLKTRSNGLDLVRWLREAGITAPIIAVTVFNMLADRNHALAAGCNDYLPKPFQLADLEQMLQRHMPAIAG